MSSTTDVGADKPVGQKSTAELVHDLTDQFSHLARTEVRLAVREAQDKAKHASPYVVAIAWPAGGAPSAPSPPHPCLRTLGGATCAVIGGP